MDLNIEKGIISLYGKNLKLDTLIKKFTQLSGEQVYHFLTNRGIQLPRRINSLALISVLNKRIKFLHSNSLSKDYFNRLQYYKYFTEQQLFNLFKKICNDENSFFAYRYNFFKLLILNFVGMNLNDGELTYLKNVKKSTVETFEQYFNYISGAALEQEDTFDGQKIDVLKEKLIVSASNQEIYDLAGKYGIDLPSRLKKEEFLAFIFYYMKNNKTYNDEIAEELSAMTISQLTTYARRTGVPMQPAMAKQELITYLFYYLEQCQIEQTSVRRLEIPQEYEPFEFTVDMTAISTFGSDELKKVIHYENDEDDKEVFNQILIDEAMDEEEEYVEEANAEPTENNEKSKNEEANPDNETEDVVNEEPVAEDNNQVEADEVEESPEDENVDVEYVEVEESVEDENVDVEYVEVEESVEDENVDVEYVEVEESVEDENADVEYVEVEESVEDENADVEYVEVEESVEDENADVEYVEEEKVDNEDSEEELDDETINKMLVASGIIKQEKAETVVSQFENVKKNEHYGSEKLEKLADGPGKLIALSICGAIALAVLIFCIWALAR